MSKSICVLKNNGIFANLDHQRGPLTHTTHVSFLFPNSANASLFFRRFLDSLQALVKFVCSNMYLLYLYEAHNQWQTCNSYKKEIETHLASKKFC